MMPLFLYRLRVRYALRLRKIHASAQRQQAVISAYDALVAREPRAYGVDRKQSLGEAAGRTEPV